MERKILAALTRERKNWNDVRELIKQESLSTEGQLIYSLIEEYYTLDDTANSVDLDILCSRVGRRVASQKHVDFLIQIIKGFGELDVSGTNIVREIRDQEAHGIGLEIASRLAQGKADAKTDELIAKYTELKSGLGVSEVEEEEFTSFSPSSLLANHFSRENLIEIWPKPLNDMIDGGAKPGHHILVFAPTEMGKTLMVINMVAGFLKNGHRTLYCGNEDPAPDILMRMMSRITGMTKYEIQDNPGRAEELLAKRNWDLFTLVSLSPGTFGQVQRLVDKYEPEVVVLDQLRNMSVDSENRTQALEKAATYARNLAKRNGVLVVSVTQAADSASRKTVLDRGDVDSSNVGIPGQCDLMIGIGADPAMEDQGLRVLSFPKNKLSGRHTPIPCQFNYALSRVEAPQ